MEFARPKRKRRLAEVPSPSAPEARLYDYREMEVKGSEEGDVIANRSAIAKAETNAEAKAEAEAVGEAEARSRAEAEEREIVTVGKANTVSTFGN
eukprot:gene10828-biopygen13676